MDAWEPNKLEELNERHKKVNAYLKANRQKQGFCMLVLFDDFADAGHSVMHSSTTVITGLFVRDRHTGCACWLLSQYTRVISLLCRASFCWMVFLSIDGTRNALLGRGQWHGLD